MGPDPSASDEIQRFEEQYRRQPDTLVFARLADAYRKAGQPDRALAVLEVGLLRHPDYPSGHIVRARTLRDLGRIDETLESFRRVLELDGGNLVAIMELAGLADERGDAGEALHWYGRLVQIDPTNLEARRRLTELESDPADPGPNSPDGDESRAWWDDSAVTLDGGDAPVWWSDSAAGIADVAGEESPGQEPGMDRGADETPPHDQPPDELRPADEVVEAILNGHVPQTVKAEDTWWYEDEPEATEPAPSQDADLLTRTMADLYAEQGLDREAAEIYEELLKDSPGDPELLARLEALREKGRPVPGEPADPGGAPGEDAGEGPAVVDAEGVPAPLGRPKGFPIAEELRRLLRMGEEHAGALPDPGSASASGLDLDPGPDPDLDPGPDPDLESAEPSGLVLDWIQRLKADS
jgi:tetratricopeptide (TPR) repeat protein